MDKTIFSEFKKIGPWLVVPSIYHFRFREETPLIDYFFALSILFLVIYLFFWVLRYFNIR